MEGDRMGEPQTELDHVPSGLGSITHTADLERTAESFAHPCDHVGNEFACEAVERFSLAGLLQTRHHYGSIQHLYGQRWIDRKLKVALRPMHGDHSRVLGHLDLLWYWYGPTPNACHIMMLSFPRFTTGYTGFR